MAVIDAYGAQPIVRDDRTWLLSPAGDFWLICAGGGLVLVALALVLHYCGDAQLSMADIVLGELHLGATYGALGRGRLWRRMPIEVVAVPVCILAATYALTFGGQLMLLTTVVLYIGAWHRCRQNLGVARHYQLQGPRPVSPWHRRLFNTAMYLPMGAGVAYYAGAAPLHEGEAYFGIALDPAVLGTLGVAAGASLAAYLAFAARDDVAVHPAERWLVIANALAFGSAYVLGAWSVSFILVLALHHEIQYLCFTYAMARRSSATRVPRAIELRPLAAFAFWPAIGLAAWAACKVLDSAWLAPLLIGGLLCHYWLDSRIWTGRARRLAG